MENKLVNTLKELLLMESDLMSLLTCFVELNMVDIGIVLQHGGEIQNQIDIAIC